MGSDPIALVRRAIALNRSPGFNFPGYFLQLAFDRVAERSARLSLDTGPHCADADGQMDIGPFALLADMALASSLRGSVGPSARVATVRMDLELTGAPRTGRLVATTSMDGFVRGPGGRQGLARGQIRNGRELVATASGGFMVIGRPDATPPHPLPRRADAKRRIELPADAELSEPEAAVMAHARKSFAQAGERSFIQRFWGYLPHHVKGGATCVAWNGPHVGNRVGHSQGGFTFGLAAATASAALGKEWHLVAVSAWYLSPGLGHELRAESQVLHHGTLTAVVRTRIIGGNDRPVLEAVTSHAK